MGVVPKSTLNPYFQDCQRGAREAAQELGFTLALGRPARCGCRRQAAIVEEWTREGLPAIAVSVESQAAAQSDPQATRARAASRS